MSYTPQESKCGITVATASGCIQAGVVHVVLSIKNSHWLLPLPPSYHDLIFKTPSFPPQLALGFQSGAPDGEVCYDFAVSTLPCPASAA